MSTAHMKILDPATGKFILWDGIMRTAPAKKADDTSVTPADTADTDSKDGSK